MYSLPCRQQYRSLRLDLSPDGRYLTPRKSIIFSQNQPFAALFKDSFVPVSDDMHVWWAMVIRVDRNTIAAQPENGRHGVIIA
jgi:hypothetical protein